MTSEIKTDTEAFSAVSRPKYVTKSDLNEFKQEIKDQLEHHFTWRQVMDEALRLTVAAHFAKFQIFLDKQQHLMELIIERLAKKKGKDK